jgi:hypothetical protein
MMRKLFSLLFFGSVIFAQPPAEDHFEKKVRPVLVKRCQGCHNARAGQAGLDLTSAAGLRKGADTGPVVVAGDAAASRLLQVTSYLERMKMPPTGKLPDEELAALRTWVERGAVWPGAGSETVGPVRVAKKGYSRAQKEFWSFRRLEKPAPPAVRNEGWLRTPVDRFILAKLEAAQLQPAPPADKRTLLHRVTLDLTGLPPTAEEADAFVADGSDGAFAKVVDRLLASPRYGEKWGRHWMDVARYADSTGADEDYRYPHAWRYRDYVINAFNADVPYDRFIREQIAGDLLPPSPGEAVNTAGIVATGFLALGPKLVAEQDKVKMFYDIVDEQIDVAGKAILGLTISCARCHDHKFDPVSTKDYYSLASIFASTKQLAQIEGTVSKLYYAPLVAKPQAAEFEAHQKLVAAKQAEIAAVKATEGRRFRDLHAPRIAEYMLAARQVYAEGAVVAAVAAQGGLDRPLLDRWVAYLKPTKERRAHLEPFYEAPEKAARYQADFLAEVARRNAEPKKKFLAGDNRFYTEVVGGKGPLTLPADKPEMFYALEARQQIGALEAELKAIKAKAPLEPPYACAVGEDQPVEQRVFLRGNPESKGDVVPKRFPEILAGEEQAPITQGSGRLELANWLASGQSPLPARVMVNRIWQGHFGQGLVRTPNNFGLAGERPSHPELLDWLAAEFMERGWSIKQMHRTLLLSNTYRQSAMVEESKRQKDPENRLLSRFAIRRKTVEEIRDSLLSIDGSLDLTMGGTLQIGEGTDNEFSDSRKSIDPDRSTRRTVYLPIRRSNLSSLFNLFDFGDGTTSTETRSETNVAPQALYMMNSQFVAGRAANLAGRAKQWPGGPDEKMQRVWRQVLGRDAAAAELAAGRDFLAGFPGGADLAWTSYCRSLIASNDFLYVY